MIGALNAWLPCGMLYAAATAATGFGGASHAAAFMLLFGAGTLPALVAVSLGATLVPGSLRLRLRAAAPLVLASIGVLLLLRSVGSAAAGHVAGTPHEHSERVDADR
jgi:sulfite exporter TauE/SafE